MRGPPTYAILASMIVLAALGGYAAKTDRSQNTAIAHAATSDSSNHDALVLPAGTQFVVVLSDHLATDVSVAGDTFRARTAEPIVVDGKTVIPAGATITGVVQDVRAAGRVKGGARMTLEYDYIRIPLGRPHSIAAQPLILQAATETSSNIERIAAGKVLGASIGGVESDHKDAVAGSGGNSIVVLPTKGDELELNAGQWLLVQMTSSTSVRLLASY